MQKQVFVGGLNKTITAEDLSTAFSAFGKIVFQHIKTNADGSGRGFAYVRFQKLKSAEAALQKGSITIRQTQVHIKPCVHVVHSDTLKAHKECSKVFVGGLTQKLQKDDILKYFSQFGEVEELNLVTDPLTGTVNPFCFCVFRDPQSARQLLSYPDPHYICGVKIHVGKAARKLDDQKEPAELPPKRETASCLNHAEDNLTFRASAGLDSTSKAHLVSLGGHKFLQLL